MMAAGQAGAPRGDGDTPARIAAVIRLAGDEVRVGSALQSVAWADEQLAVDLGSTDSTIRACDAQGVRIVEQDGLSEETARRQVDWVLLIEGHEEVPSELAQEIRRAVSVSGSASVPVGYCIERRVSVLGRTLRSHSWRTPRRVRLVRRDAVLWRSDTLGVDSLPVQGHVERLATPLLAEPCVTIRYYVNRMNILTNAAAQAHHRATEPVRWVDLALRACARALRILPGVAARDGTAGIILAVLEGYSLVLTCAKRWELEHVRGRRARV